MIWWLIISLNVCTARYIDHKMLIIHVNIWKIDIIYMYQGSQTFLKTKQPAVANVLHNICSITILKCWLYMWIYASRYRFYVYIIQHPQRNNILWERYNHGLGKRIMYKNVYRAKCQGNEFKSKNCNMIMQPRSKFLWLEFDARIEFELKQNVLM